MKRYYKVFAALPLFVLIVFFSSQVSAQQVRTWMCPPSSATSLTNNLAANQVMELLSGSMEPDSIIDVVRGNDTLRIGTGGANLIFPFVIAGPAVVTFRKTATGGQGTILSYRITQQLVANPPQ